MTLFYVRLTIKLTSINVLQKKTWQKSNNPFERSSTDLNLEASLRKVVLRTWPEPRHPTSLDLESKVR